MVGDSWLDGFKADLQGELSGRSGDVLAAYNDLEYFSRWVIGYDNAEYTKSNPLHLRRIYEAIQYTDEDLLAIAPRNSAKSSAVTVTSTAWLVGRNPLIRILVAVASMDAQGLAFMRQLDQIITKNERYIKVFGQLKPEKPDKWTDTEKIVARPTPSSGLKDATLTCVGLGSAVPSKRADIVVCDDLVTMDNAATEGQRNKVINFVKWTLFPILVPTGRRFVVGTRWAQGDLYEHLADAWGVPLPKAKPVDVTSYIRERWREVGLDEEAVVNFLGREAANEAQGGERPLFDPAELPPLDNLDAILEAMEQISKVARHG